MNRRNPNRRLYRLSCSSKTYAIFPYISNVYCSKMFCFHYFFVFLNHFLHLHQSQIFASFASFILFSFFNPLSANPAIRSNRLKDHASFSATNYLFIVNNRNSRKIVWNMFKVNKKTPITPEWRHWRCSGFFIVNFEQLLINCLLSRY